MKSSTGWSEVVSPESVEGARQDGNCIESALGVPLAIVSPYERVTAATGERRPVVVLVTDAGSFAPTRTELTPGEAEDLGELLIEHARRIEGAR